MKSILTKPTRFHQIRRSTLHERLRQLTSKRPGTHFKNPDAEHSAMARRAALALTMGACLALSACNSTSGAAPPVREVIVGGVGDECTIPSDCREGLGCVNGACGPTGDLNEGDPCALTGQCSDGLFCGFAGACEAAGDSPLDGPCGQTADCQAGFVCAPVGLSGQCAPAGEGDLNDECEGFGDCLAGLGCAPPRLEPDGPLRCQPLSDGGAPRLFEGVACAPTDDGPLRSYFEVPGDSPAVEFYRLPFPNDARRSGSRPVVGDHPTPGAELLGFDIVKTYLDAIESQQEGFGLNQAVYLRFSGRIDFDLLDARSEDASHYLMDITPDSDEYNERQPIFWQANSARGRYICNNWMSVRPSWGRPLNPNTTYAVLITDVVRGEDGAELTQDEDFAKMLSEDRPNPDLIDAWNAYAPLRAYLADQDIDPATLKGGAVFTTGDPTAVVENLRAATRDEGAPQASDLTLCEGDSSSPCDDGLSGDAHRRGCFGEQDGFHEVHGRVTLPVFQRGEAPYLEEGGGVEQQGDTPVVQRSESVCMAMTVPKAVAMPEAGWPVVIYAHGTGGSYRSHVENISPMVTEMTVGDRTTHALVIGWDQVQHFTRRGDVALDPELLVYNTRNPEAARGNFLQAVADLYAIAHFVESLDIAAEDSPTGEAIKADPTQVYFIGHSQGATSGALALPFEPVIRGTVLSGAGASLTYSLVGKTSPFNAAAGLALALQDTDIGESHPVLSLLQGYFDGVDPVSTAARISAISVEGRTTPKHVLHTIGLRDSFTPRATLETMAVALRSDVVAPLIEQFERREVEPVDPPVSGNEVTSGEPWTLVSRQYEPTDYDGHFVLFRDADAMDDMVEFLTTGILDGVPTIED